MIIWVKHIPFWSELLRAHKVEYLQYYVSLKSSIYFYSSCHNFKLKQNLEFIAKRLATSDSDVTLPMWVYST